MIGDSDDGQAAQLNSDDRPACEFQAGDYIGRYRVIRELGMGGFGHVVLARDPRLNREVAIKIPRRDRPAIHRDKFFEEGRSVARLNHPSIVNVYDIEETDQGLPFAVLEFVEGPTLHQVIRRSGLTFSRAVEYLVQIGEALVYAHGKTLIHRDLKPANVIIAEDGNRAKLMDFGMALHDLTPEENLSRFPEGTPPYMSPETGAGRKSSLGSAHGFMGCRRDDVRDVDRKAAVLEPRRFGPDTGYLFKGPGRADSFEQRCSGRTVADLHEVPRKVDEHAVPELLPSSSMI